MIKKLLLLLALIPSFVFAAAFEGDYPNRYYGYFETLQLNNENVMLSYFNNGWIDDDKQSDLQILDSFVENNYLISLSTYGIYASDIATGYTSGLNDSNLRYFEQNICVSSSNLKFWITNSSSDDFESNNNPYYVITDLGCDLYTGTSIANIEGPTYWSWLQKDEYRYGYVLKLFMPISQWKYVSGQNPYWQAVSRLHIKNTGDYQVYFRFLTSGGLYDHSRYNEYSSSFALDTENFDITYQAIMDGLGIIDEETKLHWQVSKNLLNATSNSINVGNLTITRNSDGSYTLNGTSRSTVYYFRLGDNFTLESGTYTLSNGNYNASSDTAIFYDGGNNFDTSVQRLPVSTKTFNSSVIIEPFIRIAPGVFFDNFTIYPMINKGSYADIYCPYGPTLDNNCVSHYVDDLIIWDDNDIFTNIYNIFNFPIKVGSFVLAGANGQCTPISFVIFNKEISLPCGSFFWNRDDVSNFRIFWNLLFGGFLIFKSLIWFIKVLSSVIDPLGDSTSIALDIGNVNIRKKGD